MNGFASRHVLAVVLFWGLFLSLLAVAPAYAGDDPPPEPPAPKPVEPPKPGDPPKPPKPPEQSWVEALVEKLETKVSADFVDTPLEDICAFATKVTGVAIAIDPRADLVGKSSSLQVSGATLKAMLDLAAEAHGAVYVPCCGLLVFTTKARADKLPIDAGAVPEPMRAKAETLVDLNFAGVPMKDVVGFVRGLVEVDIAIAPGVDSARAITLEVHKIRAVHVLTLVAEFCDGELSWVESGLVIKVRTPPEPGK